MTLAPRGRGATPFHPVGELIIFNMQTAELCFGLCQQ